MPTNGERITALEKWTRDHDLKHAANPLHAAVHSHPQYALADHEHVEPPPDPEPPDPPDPTPGTRPWAAPVAPSVVALPATVADIAGINAWLADVPAGSTVVFPPGRTYAGPVGIKLERRSHLVLDGNGSTLRMTGAGNQDNSSAFIVRQCQHVAIEDFVVDGGDPGPLSSSRGENAHVLTVSGWYGGGPSSFVEIAFVRGSRVHGDFAYLEGENVGAGRPSDHVWVHDCEGTDLGRNAVSWINVVDVLVEDNVWDRVSYHVYDVEPNFPDAQHLTLFDRVQRVTVRREEVGSFAHRTGLLGYLIADVPLGTSAVVSDVAFEDIEVAGIAAAGYGGKARALNTKFISKGGVRHQRISLRDLRTTRAVPNTQGDPVVYLSGVDGVTVQGIAQPVTAGSSTDVTRFDGCTGVVES